MNVALYYYKFYCYLSSLRSEKRKFIKAVSMGKILTNA